MVAMIIMAEEATIMMMATIMMATILSTHS